MALFLISAFLININLRAVPEIIRCRNVLGWNKETFDDRHMMLIK